MQTFATCNDDFNTPGTNVPGLFADHPELAACLVQEGKAEDYRRLMDARFGVAQDTKDGPARAGSVIVWRTGVGLAARRPHWVFAVAGGDLLARWLLTLLVMVDGQPTLLIAGHRPPVRDRFLWPAFDVVLAARVQLALRRGHAVIVGMDFNQRDPAVLARRCGLRWVGRGIDGFLVSDRVTVNNLRTAPTNTSDHHPVLADFTVRSAH